MNLTFSHYRIRDYQQADLGGLCEIIGDPDLMKEMDHPYTREETEQFLHQYGLCDGPYVYALQDIEADKLAGHVIFHSFDEDSFEIGWIIHPSYQGRTLAQRCTEKLIEEGRRNGIRHFVMECTAGNHASRRIIEKCGFEFLGNDSDGLLLFRRDI